jgi:hypothetical protein
MEQEHRMLDARILQGQGYKQVQIAESRGEILCKRPINHNC